ncbi:DUF1835 domain-containing protein [Algibacter miyuki]|uniref:DUF1835 domain-containing protein n=1 Tax=Algibacter miyuki TaxID=1306933 RepID=A0ABV5GZH4_9FLAO|nr:DUF1835 domain-containing protein [Algibacter miyuki]MDN3667440.1 DUF1835 domain-containing protein [Algibacter miyuki]
MEKQILHITNGGNLSSRLKELEIPGAQFTWQEMFCEGRTTEHIISDESVKLRSEFLSDFYDIDLDLSKVEQALEQLNEAKNRYSEIVLWFDYHLYCHINMVAVISLIHQKKIKLPMSLVCSGRTPGSKNLSTFSELNGSQLQSHYKNKVYLNDADIDMATTVWGIYCGKDHNLLKPIIVKPSNFKYLSNCLKAHLERFPDSINGLNILERNILKIVKDYNIKSKNHLLGYALNYQGYYGYNDLQLSRTINKLSLFLTEEKSSITLNRDGHEALLGGHNFSSQIDSNMYFGGIKKYDFYFSKSENKLIKTISDAN